MQCDKKFVEVKENIILKIYNNIVGINVGY